MQKHRWKWMTLACTTPWQRVCVTSTNWPKSSRSAGLTTGKRFLLCRGCWLNWFCSPKNCCRERSKHKRFKRMLFIGTKRPANFQGNPSYQMTLKQLIVQELCESRGGRPGLFVLTSLLVSVDVKLYWTMLRHWSQLVPNMSTDIWGH